MADTLTTDEDLDYAEQFVAQQHRALAGLVHPSAGFDAWGAGLAAISDFSDYCRPSCGYLETGECASGGEGVCPCLCKHDDTAAV